ncbi:hypothetical protein QR685DRAFT_432888, partial [Neurospora intermedia]
YFTIKYIKLVRTFLSFNIVRNRNKRTVFVLQKRYTRLIISKFNSNIVNELLYLVKIP